MKNIIKKSSKLSVLGILAIVGIASAALLTTYVTTTGTATIDQSVVFESDKGTTHSYAANGVAGFTEEKQDDLENRSDMTAPVKFETNCSNGGGVDTSYWSEVELSTKNTSTWQVTNTSKGTLRYELAEDEFNYEFDATGLTTDASYSLIYYADKQDRFANWGGDNPGALIATFTADSNGDIVDEAGSTNLVMNLPHADDWNGTSDADYCDNANGFDDYNLCRGAKIWLVPTGDYNATAKTVSWTNYNAYLYETDMIVYNDVNTMGEALNFGTGVLDFFIRNSFPVNLGGGTYTITTSVNPAQ